MSDSPILHPTLKNQKYHFYRKYNFVLKVTFVLFASSSDNWILQTISWTSEKILGKWQTRKTVTIVKETLILIICSRPEFELSCLRNDIKTKKLRIANNPTGIM